MEDYKKKYEHALDNLKKIKAANKDNKELVDFIEYEYPELKESEDERIRKELITYLKSQGCSTVWDFNGWIAWLEKQGEQKTNDKVEPKFKVGDWISCDPGFIIGRVISFDGDYYHYISPDGVEQPIHASNINSCHLWTIRDAKDGDVLAAHECLVLFKEIDGLNIKCYCTYHFMNNQMFHVDTLQNKTAFYPATKKQCDLLFSKMKEAGYEWDAEKKELKVIKEQNPTVWTDKDWSYYNKLEFFLEVQDHYSPTESSSAYQKDVHETLLWLKSLRPKHVAWSEEDEKYYDSALWHIKNSCGIEGNIYNWLKSLKERMKGE